MRSNFFFSDFIKKDAYINKNFLKLNVFLFNYKNSSFVLGKKNNVFFYKIDKMILFLTEFIYYYYFFFENSSKNLFFSDERLLFFFCREACLRSFQSIFFGFYQGGFFSNNFDRNENFMKKIDMFLFLSIKNYILGFHELKTLNKPFFVFLKKNTKFENYVFYKLFLKDDVFFFQYFILRCISNFLIKIQLYHYIELKKLKSESIKN